MCVLVDLRSLEPLSVRVCVRVLLCGAGSHVDHAHPGTLWQAPRANEKKQRLFCADDTHSHSHSLIHTHTQDDDLDKLHHADLSGLSSGALGNPGTLEDVSADIRMRFG
jgi:hypothetical protein